jgi:hypothetical protein
VLVWQRGHTWHGWEGCPQMPTNIVDKNILCGLLANIYPLTNSLTKLYFIGIPNKKLSFIEINCQFIKVIDFNNY